jgi:hypothetical protein
MGSGTYLRYSRKVKAIPVEPVEALRVVRG